MRLLKGLVLVVVVIPAVVLGSWLATEAVIVRTSDREFCASCHSMKVFAEAYGQDVHGGLNPNGIRAACVDCHLPHESRLGYLVAKARTGIHDVWAELTRDTAAIDWRAMREHREAYVYDSGCLHCHSDLQRATERDSKAFVAHRPYFLGETDKQCVSCHPHVGHKDLGARLGTPGERPNEPSGGAS